MFKPESAKEPSANSQSPAKAGNRHQGGNLALVRYVHMGLQGLTQTAEEENTFVA